MGCTSSAPTMVSTNPTEKNLEIIKEKHDESIKEVEPTMQVEEERGTNDIKVLPSCDTLAEPIQLDSINKSMVDAYKLDLDKEMPTNTSEQVENKTMPKERIDNEQNEEHLSSLEEVVDKVVKLYVVETLLNNQQNPEQEQYLEAVSGKIVYEQSDNTKFMLSDETKQLGTELNEQNNEIEQASSPTKSTSSRATRWEALADIAAELPPSLAVDPLTGQIYAVTK